MDICYVINQLAPGGAPTLLLDLVRASKRDISFTVCQIEGESTIAGRFREAGAKVVNFDASFKFDPRALIKMHVFFRTHDFDLIHAHLPYSQFLTRLTSELATESTPIVSTQHNVSQNYHPITRVLESQTQGYDSVTVAVSEGVERSFRGSSSVYPTVDDGWTTIYNGIDYSSFSDSVSSANSDDLRDKFKIGENTTVFLNVARYTEPKAQHIAIRAMNTIVERTDDACLLIVGWGPRERELQRLVRKLGLENSVYITGKVPDIEPYYSLADAFVLPSEYEGAPIVLLEAMSSSLPIVATDIPGVNELVLNNQTGYLVPLNDTSTFAKRMIDLCDSDKRQELGSAGFERVKQDFSIEEVTKNHLDLYDRVIMGEFE